MYICIGNIDECLTSSTCDTGSACVDIVGSYICLPVITEVTSIAELNMSGGELVSLILQFEQETNFLGFDQPINDLYYLTIYYGTEHWSFQNIEWDYQYDTAELLLNITTSQGMLRHIF